MNRRTFLLSLPLAPAALKAAAKKRAAPGKHPVAKNFMRQTSSAGLYTLTRVAVSPMTPEAFALLAEIERPR